MQLEVKIDHEAVQQQLVAAIVNGAIGREIQGAIDDLLSEKNKGWGGSVGIVKNAVNHALEVEIAKVCADAMIERREQIKALLLGQLTDEVVAKMTAAAWSVMQGNLTKASERY